jgi:hypothetical protein
MASNWADEAERQARAVTRDLGEVGAPKGVRVTYQKREARFALKEGTSLTYFSAHDYERAGGVDWLQLRIDILTRVKNGARPRTTVAAEERLI